MIDPNSDSQILASTLRVGTDGLRIDMGDGNIPIEARFPDGINRDALQQWCEYVRSEYNARKESQADTLDSSSDARRGADERDDAVPADPRRVRPPEEPDQPTTKAGMVARLEAQRRVSESRRIEIAERLAQLDVELEELLAEQRMVERYLVALEGLLNGEQREETDAAE